MVWLLFYFISSFAFSGLFFIVLISANMKTVEKVNLKGSDCFFSLYNETSERFLNLWK